MNAADAESRYLEIARSLGWSDQVASTEVLKPRESDDDETIVWDDDDSVQHGGGGGMGLSVSTMAAPEEEYDGSVHGLAVSNDSNGMALLLQENPATDLNTQDEFVSSVSGRYHPRLNTTRQGYTPLHLASDRGHLAMVKFLLSKGADPTIKVITTLSLRQRVTECFLGLRRSLCIRIGTVCWSRRHRRASRSSRLNIIRGVRLLLPP